MTLQASPGHAAHEDDAHHPAELPVLWHLKVSNYNEKARWALDYKRVPHRRRAAVPGRHRALAHQLAGGSTFPVLVLEREAIADSTAIIETLEQRYPDPPLYPPQPVDRRRSLELEEFFDEQLGPYSRLLFLHCTLPDAKLMLGAFAPDLHGLSATLARAMFPAVRRRVRTEFRISPESVALAYDKLAAAGHRFQSSLQSSGYLAGNRFSVADLTLAALIAPLVSPSQFPYPQPQRGHHRLAPLRDALKDAGLLDWTREMYARHRGKSAEVPDRSARASRGRWRG